MEEIKVFLGGLSSPLERPYIPWVPLSRRQKQRQLVLPRTHTAASDPRVRLSRSPASGPDKSRLSLRKVARLILRGPAELGRSGFWPGRFFPITTTLPARSESPGQSHFFPLTSVEVGRLQDSQQPAFRIFHLVTDNHTHTQTHAHTHTHMHITQGWVAHARLCSINKREALQTLPEGWTATAHAEAPLR